MKSDPGLLLLGSLGAALLTAGGAYLRAAFISKKDGESDEAQTLRARLDAATRQLAALRAELSEANSARETQGLEMVEQRQRAERQAQSSQAEVERLAAEVVELKKKRPNVPDSKTPPSASRPSEVAELRRKVKAATDDKEAARAKVEALERLVEGVRARSRELAEELKALKRQ
jgi:predicted  nucleic acid-binding Zn-ribbon protein